MIYQYCYNAKSPFYANKSLGKGSVQINKSDYQVIIDFINGIEPLVIFRNDEYYSVYLHLNIKDYKIYYNPKNIYISSDVYNFEVEIFVSTNQLVISDCRPGAAWRGYLIKSQVIEKFNHLIRHMKKQLKELKSSKEKLEKRLQTFVLTL